MITQQEYSQEEIAQRARENNEMYFSPNEPCPVHNCFMCPNYENRKCSLISITPEESYNW